MPGVWVEEVKKPVTRFKNFLVPWVFALTCNQSRFDTVLDEQVHFIVVRHKRLHSTVRSILYSAYPETSFSQARFVTMRSASHRGIHHGHPLI